MPDSEQILNAISALSGEMHNLQTELNFKTDGLQTKTDARFGDLRLQTIGCDVRIDRIEALTRKVLNVAYTARSDVRVLRQEVRAWAKNVAEMQLKTA